MEKMILIGSRNLGIECEWSDWDYAILDLEEGGTFHHIVNDRFEPQKHCYHYNKDYRYRVARFEQTGEYDWQFIYNAEDYKAGLIDINPFDYKEQWIEQLKLIDFYHPYWFSVNRHVPLKRSYHIVYNLEVLKEGSLNISEEALKRVKRYHDREVSLKEYEDLIEEIKSLK